jgi:hypothetical protein
MGTRAIGSGEAAERTQAAANGIDPRSPEGDSGHISKNADAAK